MKVRSVSRTLPDTFPSFDFVSLVSFFFRPRTLRQHPPFRIRPFACFALQSILTVKYPVAIIWEIPGQLFGSLLNFEQ